MKVGIRKPSIKKSIKARTTGKAKRAIKKAVVPGYGKKGSGWIKDPKKAAYNKIYNKTTIGVNDIAKIANTNSKKTTKTSSPTNQVVDSKSNPSKTTYIICGILLIIIGVFLFLTGLLFLAESLIGGFVIILLGVFFFKIGRKYKEIAKTQNNNVKE